MDSGDAGAAAAAAAAQHSAARVLIDPVELGLSAISGINTAELMSLPDAVAQTGIKGLRANVTVAMVMAENKLADDQELSQPQWQTLTQDEIAAINLYTQESEFYSKLNAVLRNRDRKLIKPFLPYLRLLVQGLLKLPARSKTVFRGVKLNVADKFRPGRKHIWWAVSSTSSTVAVLNSTQFCGMDGDRTIFSIEMQHGRDIAPFSAIESEEEIVLMLGTQLQVCGVVGLGHGLHLVQLKEHAQPLVMTQFEDT